MSRAESRTAESCPSAGPPRRTNAGACAAEGPQVHGAAGAPARAGGAPGGGARGLLAPGDLRPEQREGAGAGGEGERGDRPVAAPRHTAAAGASAGPARPCPPPPWGRRAKRRQLPPQPLPLPLPLPLRLPCARHRQHPPRLRASSLPLSSLCPRRRRRRRRTTRWSATACGAALCSETSCARACVSQSRGHCLGHERVPLAWEAGVLS